MKNKKIHKNNRQHWDMPEQYVKHKHKYTHALVYRWRYVPVKIKMATCHWKKWEQGPGLCYDERAQPRACAHLSTSAPAGKQPSAPSRTRCRSPVWPPTTAAPCPGQRRPDEGSLSAGRRGAHRQLCPAAPPVPATQVTRTLDRTQAHTHTPRSADNNRR